jgi:2-polyprenyl-3-methyl-5-hydroxy-6-metoxy-1,4-benzoquinol methylase
MLCSAATDPYTCCGFHKVICTSAVDDFLIHHMSNRYAGRIGLPISHFKEQIQTLGDIQRGIHPVSTLCEVEPKTLQRNWYKCYYENPSDELLNMVPKDARTILSVGCGWGATEIELKKRGSKVTALALDSVIGAVAARLGIEVIYTTAMEGLHSLQGRKYDCVLITNLLHLIPDQWTVLMGYARLVGKGGTLVITGPNFEFFPHLARRVLGAGDYRKLRDFSQSGLHVHGTRTVHRQIERMGFRVSSLQWLDFAQPQRLLMLHRWPKRLVARNWIIGAQRDEAD